MSLVDNIFDMIYYINLEKDEDRNNNMLKYFALFDIKNYKRTEGSVVDVDLSSIPYSAYRNFNRKDENYIKNALGCRLSHLKCIADAKQNNYKRILIFEDDVQFSKNLDDLLLGNYNNLHDFDMLYLGGLEEQLFRNQIVTTHAYALSENIYEDILNMAIPSGMEIDNFYAKIIQHMSVNNRVGGKYIVKKTEPFNTVYQDRQNFKSNFDQ
jgi:GR25 family glycosyltransferase involved in LPS biosynthesis